MPASIHDHDDEDDQYASAEDSDFAPEDDAQAAVSEASDSEDNDGAAESIAGKRKQSMGDGADADEDAGFENSGDEAIITKGKKRRRKYKGGDGDGDGQGQDGDGDGEGDEGPLVKTRSMRAAEKAERKAAAVNGPVTVDVDALWAQMMSGSTVTAPTIQPDASNEATAADTGDAPISTVATAAAATGEEPADMIRIKRTIKFAGKIQHEEKLVPRDSAEAKLYLASQAGAVVSGEEGPAEEETAAARPLRKAFRSAYEPVLEPAFAAAIAAGRRADLDLGVAVRLRLRNDPKAKATKLNTVEKSRLDWAGYVDREGLKDELELAGRAKGSYAARQDFLARSEAVREEDARRARLAGKA